MSSAKLWIDCSGSIDDILALIILLDAPGYDIVGISCVTGRVAVQLGIRNIYRTLEVCNRTDIPIYRGAQEPLAYPFPKIDPAFLALETSESIVSTSLKRKSTDSSTEISEQHAALHLIHAAKHTASKAPKKISLYECCADELCLVSLGPLTNIAIACLLDPYFPENLGRFLAVGGCEGRGDVTLTSEFNFYVDPEAACTILRKCRNISLVTRDLAQKHVWNMEDEWFEQAKTSKARFLERILQAYEERNGKMEWTGSGVLTAAIITSPDLIITTSPAICRIECAGRLTRGQSVLDFDSKSEDGYRVEVIMEVDDIQFHQLLRNVTI